MKTRITFKTPNAVDNAIDQLFPQLCVGTNESGGDEPTSEEYDAAENFRKFLETFIRNGELLTVEFDSDEGTATIFNCKQNRND